MAIDSHTLRLMLERRSGHTISNGGDCEWLALDFESRTKQHISKNTLKRLLGFLPYEKSHYPATLDMIARYLGYKSWDDVDEALKSGISSFGKNAKTLSPSDLQEGSLVEVTYMPDRQIRLQYHGQNSFTVVESVNSQLEVGDKVTISQFALGYPLQALDVERGQHNLGTYTAAKIGGLTSVKWQ